MSRIHKTALVPHSAERMFHLVNDIVRYPEFLPWCRSAKILHESPAEVEAMLELAKGHLSKSIVTKNCLDPYHRVDLHLVEGPFKRFEGHWHFEPLGSSGCKVSLVLDFEFSHSFLNLAFDAFFSQIAGSLVEAFCQRAQDLYASPAH